MRGDVLRQQTLAGDGERLHLPDGNGVEAFQSFSLRQGHVDKLGVQALHIGQHKQLLDGSMIADIACQLGVGVVPLFGGLAEKRNVEQISLGGIGEGGLCRCDFGRTFLKSEIGKAES